MCKLEIKNETFNLDDVLHDLYWVQSRYGHIICVIRYLAIPVQYSIH